MSARATQPARSGRQTFTVNTVAKRADLAPHVVRYYTGVGLLHPRRNPSNGYRQYGDSDVQQLRFIRTARMLGFTLDDIRQILEDAGTTASNPKAARIIARRLAENEERFVEQAALHARISTVARMWTCPWKRVPDGKIVGEFVDLVSRAGAGGSTRT